MRTVQERAVVVMHTQSGAQTSSELHEKLMEECILRGGSTFVRRTGNACRSERREGRGCHPRVPFCAAVLGGRRCRRNPRYLAEAPRRVGILPVLSARTKLNKTKRFWVVRTERKTLLEPLTSKKHKQ